MDFLREVLAEGLELLLPVVQGKQRDIIGNSSNVFKEFPYPIWFQ